MPQSQPLLSEQLGFQLRNENWQRLLHFRFVVYLWSFAGVAICNIEHLEPLCGAFFSHYSGTCNIVLDTLLRRITRFYLPHICVSINVECVWRTYEIKFTCYIFVCTKIRRLVAIRLFQRITTIEHGWTIVCGLLTCFDLWILVEDLCLSFRQCIHVYSCNVGDLNYFFNVFTCLHESNEQAWTRITFQNFTILTSLTQSKHPNHHLVLLALKGNWKVLDLID